VAVRAPRFDTQMKEIQKFVQVGSAGRSLEASLAAENKEMVGQHV
jgi:hypothetical protein